MPNHPNQGKLILHQHRNIQELVNDFDRELNSIKRTNYSPMTTNTHVNRCDSDYKTCLSNEKQTRFQS